MPSSARLFGALIILAAIAALAAPGAQDAKPAPALAPARGAAEVAGALRDLAARFPETAGLFVLGRSAGGRDIAGLRIAGPGPVSPELRPSVLVAANLEGLLFAGTEAALVLADRLLAAAAKDKAAASLLATRTVYVLPLLNPDAAENAKAGVRWDKRTNDRPVDDDADGATDEDGFEDLDKNGLITQMRVRDPEGTWIPDPKEPRLLRPADPKKGETGLYKVYTEGIDNDGDGELNEDPPGGVEPARNFPHDFEQGLKAAGLHPVSEAETLALLKFMAGRPSIALVLGFSGENTLLNMAQTGQAKAAADRFKVPPQIAQAIGLETETEYTLKEIADAANASGLGGGMEITEEMIAMFLGQGPAVQLDPADRALFEAVQKDYKDALKAAKLEGLEKRARGVGKGAFAAYAYFQYGVPVFMTDVWAVPEPKREEPKDAITAERLRGMTSEEFIALGEERIDAFLKQAGAPPGATAKALLGAVKAGQLKPAQMAEMMDKMPKPAGAEGEEHPDAYVLKWAEAALGGRAFVGWAPYKHPTLGDVEIGGFAPGVRTTPPAADLAAAAAAHADFYIKLIGRLAGLRIAEIKAEPLAPGVFRIKAWISNPGGLPTATAQGRKALSAWPIRVTLGLGRGQELLSGRPVEQIPVLAAGETKKLEWTVRGAKGTKIGLKAWAPKLGAAEASVGLD